MTLQELLDQKKITKYHLSKISYIPKTTIIDICNGKSSIENCSAKTVYGIAKALGCSMEEIMNLENKKTSSFEDEEYLECGLPEYLQKSIENMKASWEKEDNGIKDLHWDVFWCELNADINCAEVDQIISSKQAWYLRRKYLRMEKN